MDGMTLFFVIVGALSVSVQFMHLVDRLEGRKRAVLSRAAPAPEIAQSGPSCVTRDVSGTRCTGHRRRRTTPTAPDRRRRRGTPPQDTEKQLRGCAGGSTTTGEHRRRNHVSV